jgi:hypothetical protein
VTGELYPRGFIVTNMSRPAERVVAFYNKRGTCEQWIKEGKRSNGRGCHVGRSRPTLFDFNFTPSPTTSAISCARSDMWADSAYRSQEIEEKLGRRGLKNRIHRRAYRNRKLSEAQKAANTTRSKVRARVEHVFGDQKNAIGAEIVRPIGIVRARCKIGMTNLVYNMRRFIILERMAEVAR